MAAHDDEQEHHGHHHLGDEAHDHAVLAGRMGVVTVGRESFADVEAGSSTCDDIEEPRGHDRAGHLRDHIGQDLSGRKTPAGSKTDRDSRVEMAAGDVADRIGHGDHAQPECEGNTDQTDTNLRKAGCDHRAPATCECEPKGADSLGRVFFHIHVSSPAFKDSGTSSGTAPALGVKSPKSGPHSGILPHLMAELGPKTRLVGGHPQFCLIHPRPQG
ncbi:hypothetical protein ACVWW5_001714 [Bradyrhizobium sp. LM3.4]